MVKVIANAIRPGNIIEHQNKLWRVVKIAHTQPGKGGAYNQMELKDIISGTKLNERFRAQENLEQVRLDQKDYTYLYDEGDTLAFMDPETYEQISLNKDVLVEGQLEFLQDNMDVVVEFHEETPLSVELPEQSTYEVVETEAVVKGQTAASSNKPAVLDNGVRVMVPPFVGTGDRIVVKTADGAYVERAKD